MFQKRSTGAQSEDGARASKPPVLAIPDDVARRWALTITLAFAVLRLFVVRASPLQLYPDEAQYWLWSRDLAFGYFSKPPMIAWLIRLTTTLGDAEAFVRLSSPLLHAATGLILYLAGRRLYDATTGLAALLVYSLMPAVQLGAFVVSTDTPLLAFLALALWFYVVVQQAEGRRGIAAAAGFGLALGLAFLAKYAALYALIGVGLHLVLAREARRAWSLGGGAAAVLAFALAAGPNLAWNAAHGFATVAHTASNANWQSGHLFRLGGLAAFLGAQFGVFGPAPFVVLVGGAVVLAARRRLSAPDVLLLCWAIPPLAIITAEAFISRANANWAAAAYVPGSILVAGWLLRWWPRWAIAATLGFQALVAAAFVVGLVQPRVADSVGFGDALKRVRGWREMTDIVVERARTDALAGPLTAVAVDDRFLFNEAAYYGRDFFGREGPPLRAWLQAGQAHSQAELAAPLTAADGARVLAASVDGADTRAMMADFDKTAGLQIVSVRLDARHDRRVDLFLGEGLKTPQPRQTALKDASRPQPTR